MPRISKQQPLDEINETDWDEIIDVNLKSAVSGFTGCASSKCGQTTAGADNYDVFSCRAVGLAALLDRVVRRPKLG